MPRGHEVLPTDGPTYKVCIKALVDLIITEAWMTAPPHKTSDTWDVTRARALKLFRKKVEEDVLNAILARPTT